MIFLTSIPCLSVLISWSVINRNKRWSYITHLRTITTPDMNGIHMFNSWAFRGLYTSTYCLFERQTPTVFRNMVFDMRSPWHNKSQGARVDRMTIFPLRCCWKCISDIQMFKWNGRNNFVFWRGNWITVCLPYLSYQFTWKDIRDSNRPNPKLNKISTFESLEFRLNVLLYIHVITNRMPFKIRLVLKYILFIRTIVCELWVEYC